MEDRIPKPGYGGSGSAARFFYCAQGDKADRGVTTTTTPPSNPADLMRYLYAFVDASGRHRSGPFTSSGSTGRGCDVGTMLHRHRTRRGYCG